MPSYLGSSFAFIGVVIAASGYAGPGPNANLGVALGGIIVCGAVYTVIGFIVPSPTSAHQVPPIRLEVDEVEKTWPCTGSSA